jgi:hypothetical protein
LKTIQSPKVSHVDSHSSTIARFSFRFTYDVTSYLFRFTYNVTSYLFRFTYNITKYPIIILLLYIIFPQISVWLFFATDENRAIVELCESTWDTFGDCIVFKSLLLENNNDVTSYVNLNRYDVTLYVNLNRYDVTLYVNLNRYDVTLYVHLNRYDVTLYVNLIRYDVTSYVNLNRYDVTLYVNPKYLFGYFLQQTRIVR